MESVVQLVGRLPEARSRSEFHIGDRHMEGVDEVGVEELPDGGRSAAEPDVLALRRLSGPLEDCRRITADEVEGGVRQSERWSLVVRSRLWFSPAPKPSRETLKF
jgi:hypothetical protein